MLVQQYRDDKDVNFRQNHNSSYQKSHCGVFEEFEGSHTGEFYKYHRIDREIKSEVFGR